MSRYLAFDFCAVLNKFCVDQGVPLDRDWRGEIRRYEKAVQGKRH